MIDLAVQFFRREERALMTSTVTVVRDGESTIDPDTGDLVTPTTTIYTGDALIRTNAWQGSDVAVADTEVRLRPWRIKLPADAASLAKNDRATVVASDNPALVGRVLRITDFYGDDWSPSAPYFAEEVT